MILNLYSLRKAKRILHRAYRLYARKKNSLALGDQEALLARFRQLQRAILNKQAKEAKELSLQVTREAACLMPKHFLDRVRNFASAVGVALLVAIVIRQMWFELYTIPTGSMRPTLKESDHLVVSKTTHGLNLPLTPSHLYFDSSLVERGSIVTFTSENMDLDSDILYFGLIPGKKQVVKRLIGKPGDTLYFYGGKIYGVDAEGREIKEFRDTKWFEDLEHIPFIRFDGKTTLTRLPNQSGIACTFYQMNEPIAKLTLTSKGIIEGEMLEKAYSDFSDLWGFKNYGMARLLDQTELKAVYPEAFEPAPLYLEILHHPSLREARLMRDEMGRVRPGLSYHTSILPLQEKHIVEIGKHMITCRFEVKDGVAFRLGDFPSDRSPKFPDVPDGTYEIQNGVVHQVYWQGVSRQVSDNHPLASLSVANVKRLYIYGFEFSLDFNPISPYAPSPSRYAYFRNGDLYLMGAPIVLKEDLALSRFLLREQEKKSVMPFYRAFGDEGEPTLEEIKARGIRVPDQMYLVLGDNHAMSGDSRQFGFVPEANLRGKVSYILWPFGGRFGSPAHPDSSLFSFPNLLVWGVGLSALGFSALRQRRLRQQWETDMSHD